MGKRRLRKQKRFDKKTRVLGARPHKSLTLTVSEKDSGAEVIRCTRRFTVSLICDDSLEARRSALQRILGGGRAVRKDIYNALLTVATIKLNKDSDCTMLTKLFSTHVGVMLERDGYTLVPKNGWSRTVEVRGYVYTFTVGK